MSLLYHILGDGAAGLTKEEPHTIRFELMLDRLRHICIDLSLNTLQPEHTSALGPFPVAPQSFINSEVIGIEGPIIVLSIVVVLEVQFATSLDRVRYGGKGSSLDIDLTYITTPRYCIIYKIAYESHSSENRL